MNRETTPILVVDDDTTSRMVVRRTLVKAGYEVIEADNGRTALELFRSRQPTLVLMDVMMPVMNGFDACREMRRESEFVSTPILMLTALDDADSIAAAFEAGATDFITKPVHPTLVAERVRYSLRARHMAEQLRTSQERLIQVQRIARVAYWDYDADRDLLRWSDDADQTLKVASDRGDWSFSGFLKELHPDDQRPVQDALNTSLSLGEPFRAEFRVTIEDGQERLFYARGELQTSRQQPLGVVVGSVQDITELRALEERLEFLANNDPLTGLPNRQSFNRLLQRAIADAARHDLGLAAMILDLDDFKTINDTLGPVHGDALLKDIARRLGTISDQSTAVARLAGDEFGLILSELDHTDDAARSAQAAIECLAEPFEIANRELFLTASIGLSVYPDDGTDVATVLKNADAALNRAKASGRNTFRYYTMDMNRRASERLSLETSLHRALERGELSLAYQPQVETASGLPVGFEALMRWSSAEHGQVPPDRFVPVLEETGLINSVGAWCLREACRQCRHWSANGHGPLTMSVNLSGRQFEMAELIDLVGLILAETDLDPHLLELEITENILMQDTAATQRTLQSLKEAGIRLAVDDFGTGYSSLVYLKRLPLNVLKIDKSFVMDLRHYDDSVIVRSTIDLAHNLGLEVVAEGVETEEARELLVSMGCDRAQGYFYGRPMSAEACTDWLSRTLSREAVNDATVTTKIDLSTLPSPDTGRDGSA